METVNLSTTDILVSLHPFLDHNIRVSKKALWQKKTGGCNCRGFSQIYCDNVNIALNVYGHCASRTRAEVYIILDYR